MTLPRISVGTFMVGLCVVALDCVVFRSFGARPNGIRASLFMTIVATLPMSNILAFAAARLLDGRARRPGGLVGFVVGGAVAILATVLGLEPALDPVERALTGTSLARWVVTSPHGEEVAIVGIVGLLPFLFQATAALACGGIGRKLAKAPIPFPKVPVRPSLRVTVSALLLAAIPAVVVEATLRSQVDPHLTRLAVGSVATFHINLFDLEFMIPKGSPVLALVGSEVRVEQDDEPHMIEQIKTGKYTRLRDRRSVKVKILDGPRAGESTAVPHCYLRVQP